MHAVRLQHRIERDLIAFVALHERPLVAPRIVRVTREIVTQQIERRFDDGLFLEVAGRRAQHAAHRKELAFDQQVRRGRIDLQREIEAFLHRIDHAIVDRHDELDARMRLAKRDQRLGEMAEREARENMHVERARQRMRFRAGAAREIVHLVHELQALAIVRFAGFGEAHGASRAMKERDAEVLLQLLHARGDHRFRHAELPRRVRETLRFGGAHERLHRHENVHPVSWNASFRASVLVAAILWRFAIPRAARPLFYVSA